MYKVEYLPVALQDVLEIARYIAFELNNPAAAERLSEAIFEAGNRLTEFPYTYPVYTPIRPLEYEYRKALVQNYIIFYRVDEKNKLVTVSRLIYAKRNYEYLLK